MSRYSKTLWDTNTIYNPTNMNHIEQGIYDADLREGGTINGQLNITNANLNVNRGSNGDTTIFAGGTISSGVSSSRGIIRLFHTNDKFVQIYPTSTTENRNITLPDKTGTVALTSDCPKYKDLEFTSLSNSDTSKYYITLTSNLLTAIGDNATVVLSTQITRFTGFSSLSDRILPNVVMDNNNLLFCFFKGATFSGVSLYVRCMYK